MSDSYQAIFDAVRSRISGGNVSDAMESVLRDAFGMASHHIACVASEYSASAYEQQRACVLYRPTLSIDGNQWCALYGDNLQAGVVGFGDTPAKAMDDFDAEWRKPLTPTKGGEAS